MATACNAHRNSRESATANADEADVRMPPMSDLAIRAEQALLGDILHLAAAGHPQPTAAASPVLPDDFYRPYHRQVLQSVLRLTARRELPTPQRVLAELPNDPDIPQELACDGRRLSELMHAATGAKTLPSAVQIVLEAALRRRMAAWSVMLRHHAEREVRDGEYVTHHVDVLRGEVTWWRNRFGPIAPAREGPAALAVPQLRLPTEPGATAPAVEVDLLASLVTFPCQLTQIPAWLSPEHLTGDWTRRLYQGIVNAYQDGQPVDSLSVARLASRVGVPDSGHLVSLLSEGMAWGHELAREIHDRAVTGLTRQAAQRLETLSGDLELTPGQVLDQAAGTLTDLHGHVARVPGRDASQPTIAATVAEMAQAYQPARSQVYPVSAVPRAA